MGLSQRLHWNYFSSVWVILCITIKVVPEKALQQRLYWNGFSPVWVIWCFPRSKAFWRLNKRVLLEKSLSQWLHWWHTLERSQAISVNEIKLSQTVVIFTSIWWHTLERRISWVGRCCRILVFPWLQYNYNLYSIYIRFFACVRSGCSLDFFGISQYIR